MTSGKGYPMEITKEQKDRILEEAQKRNDFDFMLFSVLATTGRRLGELYGVELKEETGRKKVGEKKIYYKGSVINADKTIPIYKKLNKWVGGVLVRDFNFEENVLWVWTLKQGKRIRQNPIPLTPEVSGIIKRFIDRNRLEKNNYLFRKKKRSYRQIQYKIKFYAKKAKVPTERIRDGVKYSLSVHSLRHYYITEMLRKGLSHSKLIKLTGHTTIKTLGSYDHVLATDLKGEVMDMLKEL